MMRNFNYLAPGSVEEACSMLAAHPGEAKLLAGGQSLLSPMKQRLFSPPCIVDLKAVPGLDYVRGGDGGGLRIGALATHTQVLGAREVQERYPLLVEAEAEVACVQIRNWGTLAGNLCHGDPASDSPPALIALGASVQASAPGGTRTISLEEFFKDYFETALDPEEVVMEIQVPAPPAGCGMAYLRHSMRRAMDPPTVAVAALMVLADGDSCAEVRIALGGAAEVPLRAKEAEGALRGQKVSEKAIAGAAEAAGREARPAGDAFASRDYKRAMVIHYTREALRLALSRARAGKGRR